MPRAARAVRRVPISSTPSGRAPPSPASTIDAPSPFPPRRRATTPLSQDDPGSAPMLLDPTDARTGNARRAQGRQGALGLGGGERDQEAARGLRVVGDLHQVPRNGRRDLDLVGEPGAIACT